MKIDTVYNKAEELVNDSETDAMIQQGLELANLGGRQVELKEQLAKVTDKLDSIMKEPAPAEMVHDYLAAISFGLTLKEYCEDNNKEVWDLELYELPSDDAFKALKKDAYAMKKQRNLEKFDDTISQLKAFKSEGRLVVNNCKIRARKSGGHSFNVSGSITANANDGKMSAKEAFAKLQAKAASRLGDSK